MDRSIDIERRIHENVQRVRADISDAAARAGRPPDDVSLVAVTKTRSAEEVDAVIRAGVTLVGENRVQEAEAKHPDVTESAEWHMIGHLQSNKAGAALALFDAIQSVDSVKLAERIDRLAARVNRRVRVLIEVNTSGESSKHGVAPDDALGAIERIIERGSLDVRGLMTIGTFTDDETRVRGCFSTLRHLRDGAAEATGTKLPELSMGMTNDYRWAVEEGSTLVRVGTAIFGSRQG